MTDQFTPATRYLIVATKARDRYFDLDAVREPVRHPNATHTMGTVASTRGEANDPADKPMFNNPNGVPPLDYWLINDDPPVYPKEGPMGSARFIVGDVFDVLETLEPNSVDLVFSSPPFLALRSYLPADHPDKAKEIGSEATPADFLDTLLDVVEACDRVLAPHGSLCFELGDTFSGGVGFDGTDAFSIEKGRGKMVMGGTGPMRDRSGGQWPLDKSLCGIPTLFAWSLAYGRNLLRPERETPRWRIRNLVVWARPNPPVGALGDKFRPATSYVTVATKARDRYFDIESVRVPYAPGTLRQYAADPDDPVGSQRPTAGSMRRSDEPGWQPTQKLTHAGAPPLDYWVLPTAPYKGSHYATFPPELVVKPVKAMCPLRVCRVCGEPSRRIVAKTPEYEAFRSSRSHVAEDHTDATVARHIASKGGVGSLDNAEDSGARGQLYETIGWTDCGCACPTCAGDPFNRGCPYRCDRWRTGVCLDPFAGSGTTLAVATGHGRDAIGIDIDQRNAELALERVGPLMLSVEYLNSESVA